MAGTTVETQRVLSTGIVETVAEAVGVDPTGLRTPLYEVLDPDALDALFRTADGAVTFEYLDYEVTAHATGEIDLELLQRPTE